MLRRLPRQDDPNVLVGYETNDDAGVYLLADGLALVQTVDFFTPIVDDPRTFGQVAAANSLSDVYAMGGRPLSALTVLGFPPAGDPAVMEQILLGGLDKMTEAGCTVVGGHSIRDDDLKFGYAVTGLIDPRRVWRNVGAQPGDVLLFTKALGTGVISTALKKERASAESLAASVASMTRLNRDAADALHDVEKEMPNAIHAVTDVTGFSLLGHAFEMARGGNASLEFEHRAIAYLPGALEAVREGHLPGGLKSNREFVGDCAGFADSVPEDYRALLFDPQTSGGLLIAIAPTAAERALGAFAARNVAGRRIGRAVEKRSPLLFVV